MSHGERHRSDDLLSRSCGARMSVPVAIEFPRPRGVEERALTVITSLRSQDLARPLYFRPCRATTQSALLEPTRARTSRGLPLPHETD